MAGYVLSAAVLCTVAAGLGPVAAQVQGGARLAPIPARLQAVQVPLDEPCQACKAMQGPTLAGCSGSRLSADLVLPASPRRRFRPHASRCAVP